MQQFIRYLYEYDGEKRVRNMGFVKVDKQEKECTIQIRGNGMEASKGQKIEVLVFYRKGEDYILVSQGKIACENANAHFILRFEAEDMGSDEEFARLYGVLLKSESNRIYGAVWDDSVIPIQHMMTIDEWKSKQNPVVEETETEEAESESEEDVVESEVPVAEVESEEVEAESEEPATETKAEETEMEEIETESEESEIEPEDYIEKRSRRYEKISRKDLARLPRKEWRLANNSFLLHGFYNYHHLLYIEEGENCWIGVPGIFHEKEQAAARAFGFPQFHRITEGTLELSGEETNLIEDFGYWCRAVTKGQ